MILRILAASTICLFVSAVPFPTQAQSSNAQSPGSALTSAADNGRILGSEKATLWMLIVSDFQCPFCRQWHSETWETIRREFVATGKLRVAYVNFPLGMHANAQPAAVAAMCASAQGKFWAVADRIFAAQDRWKDLRDSRKFFDDLAIGAGVSAAPYRACTDGKEVAALIDADRIRMTRAGVQSTPTFFIGGSRLEGAQPIEQFRRVIAAELAGRRP